jgi:hypothetical protein
MREVRFDMAFMFAYSLREGTHAHRCETFTSCPISIIIVTNITMIFTIIILIIISRFRRLQDDVPEATKQRRLREVISTFYEVMFFMQYHETLNP